MKLFQALFRKRSVPGHIFRGKVRLSTPVKILDVVHLRREFEIEEKNMFLLRHPFLTPEQSRGHTAALGRREANHIERIVRKKKEFKDNITNEQMLGHLRHSEAWD